MLYSQITDGVPSLPQALPFHIRLDDGSTRTSLDELSDGELRDLGFYPVNETRPPLLAGQQYGTPTVTISGGVVTAVYPVVAMVPIPREVFGIEFLRRFSAAQRIAARALAKTDPIAADFWGMFDATIQSKGSINLDDPDTVAGVNYLAAALPSEGIDPSVIRA